MENGVAGSIFTKGNIKGLIGELYPYHEKSEKNCCCDYSYLLSWSHFLLFYDNRDTESGSQEIGIGLSGPIFTQMIYIKISIENDIHTLQDGNTILCQLFIFMEPEQFFYYSAITEKLNLSHEK